MPSVAWSISQLQKMQESSWNNCPWTHKKIAIEFNVFVKLNKENESFQLALFKAQTNLSSAKSTPFTSKKPPTPDAIDSESSFVSSKELTTTKVQVQESVPEQPMTSAKSEPKKWREKTSLEKLSFWTLTTDFFCDCLDWCRVGWEHLASHHWQRPIAGNLSL